MVKVIMNNVTKKGLNNLLRVSNTFFLIILFCISFHFTLLILDFFFKLKKKREYFIANRLSTIITNINK